MINIGDTITFHGLQGTITDIKRPIGFLAECGKVKSTYTIEFADIPEDKIQNNEPDTRDNRVSESKKTESS